MTKNTKQENAVQIHDSNGVRCSIVVCCRQMELLVQHKRVVPAVYGLPWLDRDAEAPGPERVFELLPPKWWFDTIPQSPPPPWMRYAVVLMRYCPFCGKKITLTKPTIEEMEHDDVGRDDLDELIMFSTTMLMPSTPEEFRKAIQTGFNKVAEETAHDDEARN